MTGWSTQENYRSLVLQYVRHKQESKDGLMRGTRNVTEEDARNIIIYRVTVTYFLHLISMPAVFPPFCGANSANCLLFQHHFLLRAAMLALQALYTSYSNSIHLSVCLSVCLSHAGIVSKRLHVARCSLHCHIAKYV